MTPEEALRLIQQGEGQRVEFKKSLAEQNQAIEALCAFANADGGAVFFGVQNDGTVLGVSVGTNTLEELANKIAHSLFPQTIPFIDELPLAGKTVVAVTVDKASKGKLVFTGSPRTRSGRANVQMSWDEVRTRILAAEPDWSEERDRPQFEVRRQGLTRLETEFQPIILVKHISGEQIATLEWRFRGPRFDMEWRQANGSALARTRFTERFDLSQPPKEDDQVGLNEMGFELRFYWRGRWRSTLHRWPISRAGPSASSAASWEMGDEILPPLSFDEQEESGVFFV
ncbi:MAG: RNA-binding domain-containing protein [Dehalococcoidia bacterium]